MRAAAQRQRGGGAGSGAAGEGGACGGGEAAVQRSGSRGAVARNGMGGMAAHSRDARNAGAVERLTQSRTLQSDSAVTRGWPAHGRS
jgi:hypothetical protein